MRVKKRELAQNGVLSDLRVFNKRGNIEFFDKGIGKTHPRLRIEVRVLGKN